MFFSFCRLNHCISRVIPRQMVRKWKKSTWALTLRVSQLAFTTVQITDLNKSLQTTRIK